MSSATTTTATPSTQEEAATTAAATKQPVIAPLPSRSSRARPSGGGSRMAWRHLLARALQRYSTAMGKSLHRDRLLKTLQYTLWWYAHLLLSSSLSSSHNRARQAAAAAATNLSAEICWARYLTRAVEWPTAWEGLVNDSWAPSWSSSTSCCDNNSNDDDDDDKAMQGLLPKLGKLLGRLLAASMVIYYPAEHLAFGHWKVWSTTRGRWAEQYSAWSCRAWLVYILTDVVQGYLSLTTQGPLTCQKNDNNDANDNGDNNNDENWEQAKAAQKLVRHKQHVVLARNLLFLLPAYHWSLPDWDKRPWLSPPTVNLLMWLEAMLSLYQTSLEVE